MEHIIPYITLSITVLGAIFGVFLFFRNPQEDIDKKAALLAQQLELEKVANEKKFAEMSISLKEATALAQNHIHTIDTKVDTLHSLLNEMGNSIVKLSTIIDERMPQQKY